MATILEQVLDEFSSKHESCVPVANEANRRLETQIEDARTGKRRLAAELERSEERRRAIAEEAKNLRSRHEYNEKLTAAHASQFEAESHLRKLEVNRRACLTQEISWLEEKKKSTEARRLEAQRELERRADRLRRRENELRSEQHRLADLGDELRIEERSNISIQNFLRLDAKETQKLELERERLSETLEKERRAVIGAVERLDESRALVDAIAKLYRSSLKERSELIARWKRSLWLLRHRDAAIERTVKELEALREMERERSQRVSEAEAFLDREKRGNVQVEKATRRAEARLSLDEQRRAQVAKRVAELKIELETRAKAMRDLAGRTREVRAKVKRAAGDLAAKSEKLRAIEALVAQLSATIDDIGHSGRDVGERTERLREMTEREEKRRELVRKETNRLRTLIVAANARTSRLEAENKLLRVRGEGERRKREILEKREVSEEGALIEEKRRLLYDLDVEIDKCETRLERIGASTRCERTETDDTRIAELEELLEDRTRLDKLLRAELAALQTDIAKASKSVARTSLEVQRLRSEEGSLSVSIQAAEKGLARSVSCNEEKQVEESLLGLRLSRAESILGLVDERLCDLDEDGSRLRAATKEEREKARVDRELLVLEKRLALGEAAELRVAIAATISRTEKLRIRCDLWLWPVGGAEAESVAATSQAKIRAAQERSALRAEGDRLDAAIARTENEIRCMENTLRVVNASNRRFDASLGLVSDSEPLAIAAEQLDDEQRRAIESLARTNERLRIEREDLEKMKKNKETSIRHLATLDHEKKDKLADLGLLETRVTEQERRILRADETIRKLMRDIERICRENEQPLILLQEKDIATRQLDQTNRVCLERISEFTIRRFEAEAYVLKLLAARQIGLPCGRRLGDPPTHRNRLSGRSSDRSPLSSSQDSLLSGRKNVSPAAARPSPSSDAARPRLSLNIVKR